MPPLPAAQAPQPMHRPASLTSRGAKVGSGKRRAKVCAGDDAHGGDPIADRRIERIA